MSNKQRTEDRGQGTEEAAGPDVCRCQCLQNGEVCGRKVCTGAYKLERESEVANG